MHGRLRLGPVATHRHGRLWVAGLERNEFDPTTALIAAVVVSAILSLLCAGVAAWVDGWVWDGWLTPKNLAEPDAVLAMIELGAPAGRSHAPAKQPLARFWEGWGQKQERQSRPLIGLLKSGVVADHAAALKTLVVFELKRNLPLEQ